MALFQKSPDIVAKRTKAEKDNELIQKITDRFTASSSFWQQKLYNYNRVLMRDYRMELRLVRDDNTGEIKWPYRSKVFPPVTFAMAEIIAPQLVDSIFSKTPPFDITRRRGHIRTGDASKTQLLLEYQLDQRNFKGLMDEVMHEVTLLGTKILRPHWVYEAEWMTMRRTIRMLNIPVGVQEEEILEEVYEGPDIEPIPFYCFHIDPATPPGKLQQAEYIVEEIIQPVWKFKADAEYLKYDNVDEALKNIIKKEKPQTSQDESDKGYDYHGEYIHKLRYYDHERYACLVVNSGDSSKGVLVKSEDLYENHPDGKFPYFALQSRINVDEGSDIGSDEKNEYAVGGFYPFGELHINHGLQQAITTTLNQRLDQVAKGLNPPMFLNAAGLEDEEDLEYGYDPGRIYRIMDSMGVDIRSILHQVPIQDSFGSSWSNQMEFLLDMSYMGTGAHETISGEMDAKNQTATGIMQLTANAMKRFGRKVGCIVNRGLKPLMEYLVEMNARLIDADTLAYAVGNNEPIYVNPEDIIRGANIVIHVAPFYSKEIVQERLIKMAPVLAQVHPFIDLTNLIKLILESDPYIDNVDRILPEGTPMVTPFMMQTMMGMMQAQIQIAQGQALAPFSGGAGGNGQQPTQQPGGASGFAGGNIPKYDSAANVNLLQKLVAGNQGV